MAHTTNSDGTRFRESTTEVLLEHIPSSTDSPSSVSLRLNRVFEEVHKVRLVGYVVAGVPVTSGQPDYDYFTLRLGRFGTFAASNGAGGLILPLTGARTVHSYADRVIHADSSAPISLQDIDFDVRLPSKSPAQHTDYTRLLLILEVTQRRKIGTAK